MQFHNRFLHPTNTSCSAVHTTVTASKYLKKGIVLLHKRVVKAKGKNWFSFFHQKASPIMAVSKEKNVCGIIMWESVLVLWTQKIFRPRERREKTMSHARITWQREERSKERSLTQGGFWVTTSFEAWTPKLFCHNNSSPYGLPLHMLFVNAGTDYRGWILKNETTPQ